MLDLFARVCDRAGHAMGYRLLFRIVSVLLTVILCQMSAWAGMHHRGDHSHGHGSGSTGQSNGSSGGGMRLPKVRVEPLGKGGGNGSGSGSGADSSEDAGSNDAANQSGQSAYHLPVGMILPVTLQTPISTSVNQEGDRIEARVAQDFYIGATRMIARGDKLVGTLSTLKKPVRGRDAMIGISFHQLVLSTGARVPVSVKVQSSSANGLMGGGATRGTKYKKVGHRVMGLGVYNQALLGGPRSMGKHTQRAPGERMTVTFTKPVTLVLPNS